MAGIPEPRKKRFYHKNWFAELFGILGGCITASSSLVLVFYSRQKSGAEFVLPWIALGGSVFAIGNGIVKLIQAREKDTKESDEASFEGIQAAMHLIHSLVRHKCNFSRRDHDKLRVTFHKVLRDGQQLEQLLDYVGGNSDGRGRRFNIRSGICGKAARENKVLSASRNNNDYSSYIEELVSVWGYTPEEARKLSITSNSWLAVPIKYKGTEVTGVVYLDSNEKDFFTDPIKEQVVWACGGLAVFIDERYR
jgi:hypothetical protein